MKVMSLQELLAKTSSGDTAAVDAQTVREYEAARERFEGLGIPMDDQSDLMFSNHILELIRRARERSYVEWMDESLFSEVSQEAKDIAEKLVEPVFTGEGAKPDRTETLMVAMHVDVIMQKAKEGADNNE